MPFLSTLTSNASHLLKGFNAVAGSTAIDSAFVNYVSAMDLNNQEMGALDTLDMDVDSEEFVENDDASDLILASRRVVQVGYDQILADPSCITYVDEQSVSEPRLPATLYQPPVLEHALEVAAHKSAQKLGRQRATEFPKRRASREVLATTGYDLMGRKVKKAPYALTVGTTMAHAHNDSFPAVPLTSSSASGSSSSPSSASSAGNSLYSSSQGRDDLLITPPTSPIDSSSLGDCVPLTISECPPSGSSTPHTLTIRGTTFFVRPPRRRGKGSVLRRKQRALAHALKKEQEASISGIGIFSGANRLVEMARFVLGGLKRIEAPAMVSSATVAPVVRPRLGFNNRIEKPSVISSAMVVPAVRAKRLNVDAPVFTPRR